MAVKAGVGMDLNRLSDYLNLLKAGIGERVAEYALDEQALDRVMTGERVCDGDYEKIRDLSTSGYKELEKFMAIQETNASTTGCVDFRSKMKAVDDGENGSVWVSNDKVDEWLAKLPTPPI